MDDAREQLKEDVGDLESVEDLGKVEAFILELKAKGRAGKAEADCEESVPREPR